MQRSKPLSLSDFSALTEIKAHALSLGDDEIAADCDAALAGDVNALLDVRLDTLTRDDYAAWAPAAKRTAVPRLS